MKTTINSILTVASVLAISISPLALTQQASAVIDYQTQIASLNNEGDQGDSNPYDIAISKDGRYVVFGTYSTNYGTPNPDSNGLIYLKDMQTGSVSLVSASDDGTPANGTSFSTSISDDGRYVAFASYADNLIESDTNEQVDMFIKDVKTGIVTRGSVGTNGQQSNNPSYTGKISGNGRYLSFVTNSNFDENDNNGRDDVYLHDLENNTTELISRTSEGAPGDNGSFGSAISSDGRYVAFGSYATNFVPFVAPTQNGPTISGPSPVGPTIKVQEQARQIYVRDRVSNTTKIVSISNSGVFGNQDSGGELGISDDGQRVVFQTSASNLAENDTNGSDDIFVHDFTNNTTRRVSLTESGEQVVYANGESISADGRYVTFTTYSPAVESDSNNNDDVYVRDLENNTTAIISRSSSNQQGDSGSYNAKISGDGRYVLFVSDATNFYENDSNETSDLFRAKNISFTLNDDTDGANAAVENQAPNNGDANNDGIKDTIQNTVTSLVSPVNGQYVTVETSGCSSGNSLVSVTGESQATADAAFDYPAGLANFTLTSCGESASVSLYFYGDFPTNAVLRKYNSTTGTYTTVSSANIQSLTIGGKKVTKVSYEVVDNGPLDQDPQTGVIVDPAGLAVPQSATTSGSTSGLNAPNTGVEKESILMSAALLMIGSTLAISAILLLNPRRENS